MFVTTHAVVPIFVMHISISCSTTSLAFPTASLLSIAMALCSIAPVEEVLLLMVEGVVGVGVGWVAGVKAWPPDNPFLLAPSPSSFHPTSDLLELSKAESPANPAHLATSSDLPSDNPFLLDPSPSSFRPISDLLEVSRAESPANLTHLVTSSDSPRRFTVCVA